MKTIKSVSTIILTACILFTTTNMAMPEKSQAAAIVAFSNAPDTSFDRVDYIVVAAICGLGFIIAVNATAGIMSGILGGCFLDSRNPRSEVSLMNITEGYLFENGYSSNEVAQLMYEKNNLQQSMQEQNLLVAIEPADTQETLGSALKGINPNISDMLVGVIAGRAGLK